MLEHCWRDLLPFSHKSISEVGHWCWVIRPGSQSASVLRFPFIGTKGPNPKHEKQHQTIILPPPNFPVGTTHSGRQRSPGIRQTQSLRLPDGEAWFITPENAFPLLQSPMTASFTPLQTKFCIAHGNLRLGCGCSAMETHFIKLLTNSSCADIASRNSLEVGSVGCNRGDDFYMLQHSAVPFCKLVSLVFRSIHPCGWLKDELWSTLQSVVLMHLKVGCQPPYKVQRRRLKEERLLETNSVYPFICGLIVRVEDLVYFR